MTPAPGSAQHYSKLRMMLCTHWQALLWSSRATRWRSSPGWAQSAHTSLGTQQGHSHAPVLCEGSLHEQPELSHIASTVLAGEAERL